MFKRIITFFLLFSILTACVPATPRPVPVPPTGTTSATSTLATPALPWWREAVFYEIFVRSFYDTNADGIGDFNGITAKLDYLGELGITAIWLMPINPSPSYHGYDVTNFYAVNPEYGSMDDFKRLLSEAHARGIRIIMDLVLNHTSSQHPFFVDANNNPQSPYRDYYVWSESDPGNAWHKGNHGYYFGLFCDCMPDLNYRNPDVTAQMENVVRFWLEDVGVDGFRVDAAKHLIEEGPVRENTPATHAWYKDNFYPTYKALNPNAYAVGEVYGAGANMVKLYTGNQLDQIFNFEMSSGFVNSAAGMSKTGIDSAIIFSLKDMPDFNFATFLTNHDQNRVMSVLNLKVDKAKVAATLLLTSPGTPFIYYGEEIGMLGKKPDEDIRLPMQWSAQANAGFTAGSPWRSPEANYPQVNVAAQTGDPASLLSHYRALIALRSAHPALRYSNIYLVDTNKSAIYAALRIENGDTILVLVNLGDAPLSDYTLTISKSPLGAGEYTLTALMGTVAPATLSVDANGGFAKETPLPQLAPFGTYILQVKK